MVEVERVCWPQIQMCNIENIWCDRGCLLTRTPRFVSPPHIAIGNPTPTNSRDQTMICEQGFLVPYHTITITTSCSSPNHTYQSALSRPCIFLAPHAYWNDFLSWLGCQERQRSGSPNPSHPVPSNVSTTTGNAFLGFPSNIKMKSRSTLIPSSRRIEACCSIRASLCCKTGSAKYSLTHTRIPRIPAILPTININVIRGTSSHSATLNLIQLSFSLRVLTRQLEVGYLRCHDREKRELELW